MKMHLVFVGVLLLFGNLSQAYVSALSRGTAGSGRAALEPNDIPYLNPAVIAFTPGYLLATGFSHVSRSEQRLPDQDEFSVQLSDNMPDTVVPSALAYSQKKDLATEINWTQREIRLALGNVLYGRSALGVGINYRQERDVVASHQGAALTMGALFGLNDRLGLAIVAENLLPFLDEDGLRERFSPLTGLGASYNFSRTLRGRLDLTSESNNSWARPTVAMGIENFWNRWLLFQLGAARNGEKKENTWSSGLGFRGPKFGIHYAFQSVSGQNYADARHSVDLALPLW